MTAAGQTSLLQRHMIAAIMATQLISMLVIGQAHIAIGALGHVPTGGTLHHRSKPSPVLKKNDLLSFFQSFSDGLDKLFREMALHPSLTGGLFDIHQINVG